MSLTNESYARWLRAQRPPYDVFFRLSEEEQETLAGLGDDHARERATMLGFAIADPELMEAMSDPGSAESEDFLLGRIAEGAKTRLSPETLIEQSPPPVTMGGIGARREDRTARVKAEKDGARRFMGRRPEGVK